MPTVFKSPNDLATAVGKQLGDEAARNDGALVDVERNTLQPGFAREVGGRLAAADALLHQGVDLALGALVHGTLRRAIQIVQWQSQPPQHQPCGFIESVGGAVAEGDTGAFQLLRRLLDEGEQLHRAAMALRFSSVRR